MGLPQLSLSASLRFPILLMGLLVVALALAAAKVSQDLTLEDHRHLVSRMAGLLVDEAIETLRFNAVDLGLTLQQKPAFRQAFGQGDDATLRFLLNDQFHQYFATTDLIRLEKVAVFDTGLQLREESDEFDQLPQGRICPRLLERAKRRSGAARFKPLDDLCLLDGRPYHAVLVPIGGFELAGYLAVVSDPSHSLRGLHRRLCLPTQISLPDGQVLNSSPDWRPASAADRFTRIQYQLRTKDQQLALSIAVMEDISELQAKLARTKYLVALSAGLLSLLAMVFIRQWMRTQVLRPLHQLIVRLRSFNNNGRRFDQPVEAGGSRELRQLAADFNTLTDKLAESQQSLQNSAYQDGLTGLPNRLLFYDRLDQLARLCEHQESGFALLIINLDKFKAVNDRLGHHAGDILLREAAERMTLALGKSNPGMALPNSTLARVGGDEFAVILPGVRTLEQANLVATKLRETVLTPFFLSEQRVQIGMTIGIALFPQHGGSCDQLVRHADHALFEAKSSGRGLGTATHQHFGSGRR